MNGTSRIFFLPALLVLMLTATGCVKLWQEPLDVKTYMLEVSRSEGPLPAPLAEKLWIDSVSVLPPYNVRSLIVRKSDVEYEASYYTELLLTPADNVRNSLFTWFSAGGIFEEVSVTDRRKASHRLVVTVMKLYGSREADGNEAVISLKVTLLDERTKGVGVLFSRDYICKEPLSDVNAEELIRAYNRALLQVLSEVDADVVRALGRTES